MVPGQFCKYRLQNWPGGLGLSAQITSVNSYLYNKGEIVAEFTDIESGEKNNRPELLKASALCKEKGGVLLIAKLDRLKMLRPAEWGLSDFGKGSEA